MHIEITSQSNINSPMWLWIAEEINKRFNEPIQAIMLKDCEIDIKVRGVPKSESEEPQNDTQQLKDSISDLKKLIPFVDRNGCLQDGCGFDIKLNAVIAKLESI